MLMILQSLFPLSDYCLVSLEKWLCGNKLLKYAKRFLSNDTLCKMYTGLVEPYVSFCSSVWGCCMETIVKSLQRLQNRATRIVGNKPYDYSATYLLKELGRSSIKDIIFKETNIMTFEALKHDLEPSCLNGLFETLSQVHSKELRNTETDLRVSRRRNSNGQKSFSYRGAKLWNQLNNDQRSAPSLKAFMSTLGPS